MVLGQRILNTGANSKKKKLKRQHFQISSQSKYSKNRLNANSVSTYIVTTNESNIMASASIIKKDILQYYSEQTKLAW